MGEELDKFNATLSPTWSNSACARAHDEWVHICVRDKAEGGGMRMRKSPGNGCASDASRTDVTDPGGHEASGLCDTPRPTHKSEAN